MGISAVGSGAVDYGRIAGGKRIRSAADDASGLAIAKKLQRESGGMDAGASNIRDGISVANVKDGALSTMQDSLQRIRELSVKASNGLYGDSEKQMMQDEVNQLLKGIEDIATGTTFNEMKLMDGSMADMNIASNPDGSGMKIQMENTTLKSLGLDGYNITGDFDISTVDAAMDKISTARSNTGAVTNAMESAYNYNTGAALQLTGSQSRIEDLDIPKAVSEEKKNKLMEDYRMGMMRKQMDDSSLVLKMFGAM